MELYTPDTLRAGQLRDVYNSINMKHITQDERLDALLTLKHTVEVKLFIVFSHRTRLQEIFLNLNLYI